ncbi:MAG: transposase [Planctomycetia bacterium]|nr:transposase [Planctomycetia bacterium]
MDHFWLLTWTTYGTWLPGDQRGSIAHSHNLVGTPWMGPNPALEQAARTAMAGEPTYLNVAQAQVLLAQFHETVDHRGWELRAAAVMRNHVHVVLGVPGDPEPDTLMRDLKSYGSRALGGRASGKWWTRSGSRRKLPDEASVAAAVRYVGRQQYALAVWVLERTAGKGRS